MIHGKKVVVVMPAYNAEKTVEATYREIPKDVVDEVVLVDDASRDETVAVASRLGIQHVVHTENLGYGGNQKTCYTIALRLGADIVVMLHPDYQYTPRLIAPIAAMIASEHFDVVLASRILSGGALRGGMPVYKYVANRILTLVQNLLMGEKLSEYHTGFRAFNRKVLLELPLLENSNDFVFDNQMLVQAFHFGYSVGEITCPTRYLEEASSINFTRSVVYGLGVLRATVQRALARLGAGSPAFLDPAGRKLSPCLEDPLPHGVRAGAQRQTL